MVIITNRRYTSRQATILHKERIDRETSGSEKRLKIGPSASTLSVFDDNDGGKIELQFIRPLPRSTLDPSQPSPLLTSTLYFDILDHVQLGLTPTLFDEPKVTCMEDEFEWDGFIEQMKHGVLEKQTVQYLNKMEQSELEKNIDKLKRLSIQELIALLKECKKKVLADFILYHILPYLLNKDGSISLPSLPPLNEQQHTLEEPLLSLVRELIPSTSLISLSDDEFGMELTKIDFGSTSKAIAIKLEIGLLYFVYAIHRERQR
eukprot:TRINITY_DN1278_c0_g1_i14.p1 TRINITY_DN1278_c0_g1~~TRINITY_DN1278_c0_g1_i14.p1  ORF type:complete len:262 (+),score=38.79 TRINITY_DN1278_c0_g1_i14:139-924(+)